MSNYSPLKIELITTGTQAGSWGNTTNVNLGTALEEAITGSADVAFSSADVTLTLANNNASQTGRNLRLNLTGTSGGARNLILGTDMQIKKLYLINNGLAHAVTVKNTSGTGIAVPAGKSMFVFNNGTDVVDAVTHLTSLTLGTALPVASGGSGATTLTGVLKGNGTSAFTAGNVNLASEVTGTLPVANGGTGITSLGTGVATWLGTPTSANLAAAVTDETGSGSLVFATSPTLVTPNIGAATGTQLDIDNLRLDGNTISSTNTNGNVELTPNGIGRVTTSALSATSPRVITAINDTNGNKLIGVTATTSAVNEITVANAAATNSPAISATGNDTNIGINITPKGTGRTTVTQLTTTSPRVLTSIDDTNGNELFGVTATTSAVNEFTVANAATGNPPTLSATGGDTNIGIRLQPKGTGGVVFNAGAVGTPSITTTGDLNTGIYFPAADNIGFVEGGVEAMRIDSSGNVGIGTTTPATRLHSVGSEGEVARIGSGSVAFSLGVGHTGNGTGYINLFPTSSPTTSPTFLAIQMGGSERMRIDSSGNVFIGNGATAASPANGVLSATGGDGTNIAGATLTIRGGASTGSGAGGPIIFSTAAAGASGTTVRSASERMRIDSSGNVLVGITTARANAGDVQVSKGISFPATQSAQSDANTLDDYEEGTWTPVVNLSSSAPTVTYVQQTGYYTKIGRQVTVTCFLGWSAASGGSGDFRITGLPFSSANLTNNISGAGNSFDTNVSGLAGVMTYIPSNDSTAFPQTSYGVSGIGGNSITGGSFNKLWGFTLTYFTS